MGIIYLSDDSKATALRECVMNPDLYRFPAVAGIYATDGDIIILKSRLTWQQTRDLDENLFEIWGESQLKTYGYEGLWNKNIIIGSTFLNKARINEVLKQIFPY